MTYNYVVHQLKKIFTWITLLVFSLSSFQQSILVYAQTGPIEQWQIVGDVADTDVWTSPDTTDSTDTTSEPEWQMCHVPEIELKECNGTSQYTQWHQIITCNDACGHKANTAIPLKRIDEITYCLKDNTCAQAIKDYCNGLLDTKINQWPKIVQTIKSPSCIEKTNNDPTIHSDNFDDTGIGWWKDIPDPVDEENEEVLQWWTLVYNDYSCCGATVTAEKPLWQAVETYSITCDSECKHTGRTIAFNQKFKADNRCDSLETCESAIRSACNYCGIEFDGESIAIDSTFDPLRPEIGKTAADYIAENITRMNMIAWLFKPHGDTWTFTISNLAKNLIWDDMYKKIFGELVPKLDENWNKILDSAWKEIMVPKMMPKLDEFWNQVLDSNGNPIMEAQWSIVGDILTYGQYAMILIDFIRWDTEKAIQSLVNIGLSALGLPITLDIQWFLDNPVTAYLKMWLQTLNLVFPGLWTVAAMLFDVLLMNPAVGEFFHGLWEHVKKSRRSVQRFFWYTPRNKTFTCNTSCGSPNAGKEMKLSEIEEATGCAWAENCADEMFDYCQWNPLVHKNELIENCHNCSTIIKNADWQELIKGERERDHFMNMQYQCSGAWCGEEPWVIITAKQLHSMYNCSETELKKQCQKEWRENEDECYQACIEEASQKYCLWMWGDFVTTEECSANYDYDSLSQDEYFCTAWCSLREWTEFSQEYLEKKYKCADAWACLYYAKIECINPWQAKNKEESVTIAENTKFCIAVYDSIWTNEYTCPGVCNNYGKKIKLKDLEKNKNCDWEKGCQKHADEFCGWDRTSETCLITQDQQQFTCQLWCEKTPQTVITRQYLQSNYNCQWADCKPLAQQFCEGTLPEPACSVWQWGDKGDLDFLTADHYLCGAGCKKPENLQVMKRDLAKQLWCNEDGREWCRQTAIDYCDNKHPGISISDKSRIGVWIKQFGKYIAASTVIAWWLWSIFDWLWWLGVTIPSRATQTLTLVEKVNSIYWHAIDIHSQIYQVVTSDRWNRNEIITNLYAINKFEWSITQFIKIFKELTFKADEKAIEWECVAGAGQVDVDENSNLKPWTKDKIWFLGKIVNWMVVITQVFDPDDMKKLTETLNPFGTGSWWPWWDWWPWWSTNPYVNAWVVPYWTSCPDIEEIIVSTTWPWHSAPTPPPWYLIQYPWSCAFKYGLLEAYCENKLPEYYKAQTVDEVIQLVRIDVVEQELVCGDTFWRDCNPFEQGDEFLVEVFQPVIIPDKDPVKAPGNCRDGIQNNGETGLDCGEVCGTCCDGSRLWCREKVAWSVQISCGSFNDWDSCSSAWCERFYDTSDPDSRVRDYYCTGTPQICNFGDKTSCNTDTNCLRWCESDLPPKPWN
jgi:hypothetical protein